MHVYLRKGISIIIYAVNSSAPDLESLPVVLSLSSPLWLRIIRCRIPETANTPHSRILNPHPQIRIIDIRTRIITSILQERQEAIIIRFRSARDRELRKISLKHFCYGSKNGIPVIRGRSLTVEECIGDIFSVKTSPYGKIVGIRRR